MVHLCPCGEVAAAAAAPEHFTQPTRDAVSTADPLLGTSGRRPGTTRGFPLAENGGGIWSCTQIHRFRWFSAVSLPPENILRLREPRNLVAISG